jgi:GTP-binding protein
LDGTSEDPLLDYAQINSELALFDPLLSQKPVVVAFNKMDLPEVAARWPSIEAGLKKRGVKEPMCISAVAGTNLRQLLFRIARLLKESPPLITGPTEELMPVYRSAGDPRGFSIIREKDNWRVKGEAIERAAAMTYWEYDQSVRRFQRILQALGVEDALRLAGVQEGDTVAIGEYELEWSDENKGQRD